MHFIISYSKKNFVFIPKKVFRKSTSYKVGTILRELYENISKLIFKL